MWQNGETPPCGVSHTERGEQQPTRVSNGPTYSFFTRHQKHIDSLTEEEGWSFLGTNATYLSLYYSHPQCRTLGKYETHKK